MRARHLVLTLVVMMAFGSVGVSGAGEPLPDPPNPNWSNDPVEGPSPNLDHVVGNEPDGECVDDQDNPGEVLVNLFEPDPPSPVIESRVFDTDGDGNWGGPFPIPPDLDPGIYPLDAFCVEEGFESPQTHDIFFAYEARSYTVLPGPAEPVEAEPTFTG